MKPFLRNKLAALCLALAAQAWAAGPSGTLPVLHIETPGHCAIESKEVYVDNTKYWLDPMGDETIEAIGSEAEPQIMQIRGRGNYTWTGFEKKPYRLKLDKKQPMLGMDKSKHWALMAQADDNLGFLRAPMVFRLSELAGLAWTPGQQPVEVVLNGEYIGLYFLTQTVRVDKDRVDIVEQADDSTEDVSGGWLLEIDNYDDPDQIKLTEGDGSELRITYKSPEKLSAEQLGFLTGQMEALDRAFYQTDPASTEWETLVDKDALAAYYIVQEMTDNYESFHGSCYFTRNRGENIKWVWGPVWDTGSTFMRAEGRFMYDSHWHQTWIPEIVKFTTFKEAYTEAMNRFLSDGYNEIPAYINAYADRIAKAAEADAERWPQYGNRDVPAKAAEILRLWRNRVKWLAEEWKIDNPVIAGSGIYLRGEMNGWGVDPAWEFASTATEGVYELRDVTISGSFKIADEDWNPINYGTPADGVNPEPGEPFALKRGVGSKNMWADGRFAVVRFTLDEETRDATLLLLTEPDGIAALSAHMPELTVTGRTVSASGRSLSIFTPEGIAAGAGTSVTLSRPGIYIAVVSCPDTSLMRKILIK